MWPFKRAPAIPKDCDFELARAELANFFKMANQEASFGGEQVVYRQEFVKGWEQFAASPTRKSAANWILEAPDYADMLLTYFRECSPGGRFFGYRRVLDRKQ